MLYCTYNEPLDMREDERLIEKYLGGDEGAFELLLRCYSQSLYGFIFSLVRNKEAAEDILQETFLKAWKNFSQYDKAKSFKTWIFTIAKYTSFDALKKKKTTPFSAFEGEEGESFLENIPDERELIQTTLETEEENQSIEEALGRLPDKYQHILRLFYREEFSLIEISEILETSYNTVKSWHYRGIKLLQKELENAPKRNS